MKRKQVMTTDNRSMRTLTLAATMLFAVPAYSDVLIGNYRVDSKYNTAGGPDSLLDPYNPYLYPTNLPPGPIVVSGLPAGRYRFVIEGFGPTRSPVLVWYGGPAGPATFFWLNIATVGSTTEFFYGGGDFLLYWHDWYPWDNDPLTFTDVALYRVVATFQSTLDDIAILLNQALISNKGTANSLSAKIRAAAAAADRGSDAWRNQVQAFQQELQDQIAANHILGIAIQTLLFDGASLMSQSNHH
jgi:hypothetical protein